jgi:hypothetical protein
MDSLADVVWQHRYEYTRNFAETGCQGVGQVTDHLPVLQRFLCQPT